MVEHGAMYDVYCAPRSQIAYGGVLCPENHHCYSVDLQPGAIVIVITCAISSMLCDANRGR